jgi:hypothetical protein
MTPKEKAKELIDKFIHSESQDGYNDVRDIHAAIRCALIAVDKILDAIDWDYYEGRMEIEQNYWEQVKQELEKL